MASPPFLLVTDLDGTLLDHDSYSADAAAPALAAARSRRIPVIFNTSKTLAEGLKIQRQLGLEQPIIFENGAGVALPATTWPPSEGSRRDADHWLVSLAPPYEHIRAVLCELRRTQQFCFTGFGDMTVAEVSDVTGLRPESAEDARQRHFDEPLLWQDTEPHLAKFTQAIRAAGLDITRGGRFLHVVGPTDKGRAMLWLARHYPLPQPRLVALGDSDNDLPMLRAADIAVLVRSPAQQLPQLSKRDWNTSESVVSATGRPGRLVITDEEGPAGWNTAVLSLLEELACG